MTVKDSNSLSFSETNIHSETSVHYLLHHVVFSSLQEQFLIYQHLILVFNLFKLVGTLTNLAMSICHSAFKAVKPFLAAKLDISTPVAWSAFLVA